MKKQKQPEDKSDWAIGGGLIAGIGVGLFFIPQSPITFVGFLLAGLGLGLIITSIVSKKK